MSFLRGIFSCLLVKEERNLSYYSGIKAKGSPLTVTSGAFLCCRHPIPHRGIENTEKFSEEDIIYAVICGYRNVINFQGLSRVFVIEENN